MYLFGVFFVTEAEPRPALRRVEREGLEQHSHLEASAALRRSSEPIR
jgi:hypothetical protein